MKNKSLQRCYKLIKPHFKSIAIITFIAIIIDLLELAKPYLVKILIDDFIANGITKNAFLTIDMIGIGYIIIVVIGNILDYISRMRTSIMGEEVLYNLRNKIFLYSQEANIKFHDKTPSGKLYARIVNDVEDISVLFKDVVVTVVKDIILIINIIFIMFYLSIKMSLISFSVMPLMIIVTLIMTKILNKLYEESKNARTNLNTFLAESIYGAKVIKIFNIQEEKQTEHENLTSIFAKKKIPANVCEGFLWNFILALKSFAITVIIYAATKSLWGINLEIGSIYIFITYIQYLFEPVTRIIDNIEIIQDAMVSINKIYDILDEKQYLEDYESGIELKKIIGKLEFKHVWFAYEGDNWILKDISFVIEPGETIALVGKTGSGKTTITNLVNRFFDIQKGEILLDGINIKDINKRYLRRHVGTVFQDPFIYATSIKDNIKLNRNLTDEQINQAIYDASAEDFIQNLPKGINEIAKERGESFSAGQKQLIAFARIFAHNPDIFILDEATANIDTHTEKLIQKSINRLSKEKTAIFIAHRLSTIVDVDKILVLNNGEIIEEGKHEELLKKEGYYAKLYNSYYSSLG